MPMRDATDALVLDLVEWIARQPRPYSEVIETWRTSCPRLTIWEDAVDRGYVTRRPTAEGLRVTITEGGEKFLRAHGRVSELPGRLAEMGPDDLDHAIGRGAGREEAEIIAVAVDQIGEGGVVDGVAGVLV